MAAAATAAAGSLDAPQGQARGGEGRERPSSISLARLLHRSLRLGGAQVRRAVTPDRVGEGPRWRAASPEGRAHAIIEGAATGGSSMERSQAMGRSPARRDSLDEVEERRIALREDARGGEDERVALQAERTQLGHVGHGAGDVGDTVAREVDELELCGGGTQVWHKAAARSDCTHGQHARAARTGSTHGQPLRVSSTEGHEGKGASQARRSKPARARRAAAGRSTARCLRARAYEAPATRNGRRQAVSG